MQRVENALKMKDEQFKRILATTKAVFQQMLTALQFAYSFAHEKGGHPGDLSVGDKLLITLQYWREYRTMEHIAVDYGVDKGTVCRSVQWVEDVLAASGILALPGEEVLSDEKLNGEELVVDVTEHPIERPKNKQRDGTLVKKRHTIKSQIVINIRTFWIYCVHQDQGRVHDFKLCRQTILKLLMIGVMLYADSGYQGVQKFHANSVIPIKKKKQGVVGGEKEF